MQVGQKIRVKRAVLGMNQSQVATLFGMWQRMLSVLERTGIGRKKHKAQIAMFLKADPAVIRF